MCEINKNCKKSSQNWKRDFWLWVMTHEAFYTNPCDSFNSRYEIHRYKIIWKALHEYVFVRLTEARYSFVIWIKDDVYYMKFLLSSSCLVSFPRREFRQQYGLETSKHTSSSSPLAVSLLGTDLRRWFRSKSVTFAQCGLWTSLVFDVQSQMYIT